ncbi:hypothetical protein PMAYCL1PPCAC_10006 [Pristionchus mayeri]|uniref:Uncharacterized protein n=1 Tax=Pristionchus mayeri TaxID=1317129 RepID=A0AAN4ZFF8_9BILA|nr:hypothetical protein PMAYCL1PPCAC_10006 [Pristionchus mayeri]
MYAMMMLVSLSRLRKLDNQHPNFSNPEPKESPEDCRCWSRMATIFQTAYVITLTIGVAYASLQDPPVRPQGKGKDEGPIIMYFICLSIVAMKSVETWLLISTVCILISTAILSAISFIVELPVYIAAPSRAITLWLAAPCFTMGGVRIYMAEQRGYAADREAGVTSRWASIPRESMNPPPWQPRVVPRVVVPPPPPAPRSRGFTNRWDAVPRFATVPPPWARDTAHSRVPLAPPTHEAPAKTVCSTSYNSVDRTPVGTAVPVVRRPCSTNYSSVARVPAGAEAPAAGNAACSTNYNRNIRRPSIPRHTIVNMEEYKPTHATLNEPD